MPGSPSLRKPHWPLAFPEVFADTVTPGFDAVIGNPPFLGGQRISGTYGDDYLAWLQRWDGNGVAGSADLAARFLLRADHLLFRRGQLGYVTTNTIIEGSTLRVGLEQSINRSLVIRAGRSPHPWPTKSANLQIVELWASRVPLSRSAACWIDGEDVPAIGPDLEPYGRVRGRPYRLAENEGRATRGSLIAGPGFTLTAEQASDLKSRDERNAEVIYRYVIGQDLNQRPDCSGSRWVINFQGWPISRAEEYPDCLDIVRRLVKPGRDRIRDSYAREYWWRFKRHTPELYEMISGMRHVLALALVSNAVMPVRVRVDQVFSNMCGIFAFEDFANLSVLSSNIHTTWVVRYTSTFETRIRYSLSDAFFNFPMPKINAELETLGSELDTTRSELMRSRALGLTKTYNRVHDPDIHEPAIQELRDIHVAIDEAVVRAYGWADLDLKIGHHPTKIGVRWTVSKEARFELLDRLLEENHKRYEAEQQQ